MKQGNVACQPSSAYTRALVAINQNTRLSILQKNIVNILIAVASGLRPAKIYCIDPTEYQGSTLISVFALFVSPSTAATLATAAWQETLVCQQSSAVRVRG